MGGIMPLAWKTKNRGQLINADAENKLIREFEVTAASVHDSQVFDELLDQTTDKNANKRAVFADSAYRS